MSLQHKIESMSKKYRQLKECQFPVVKQMTIQELRKLAAEANQIMNQNQHPSNSKKRRQIDDVLKKCSQIQKEIKVETEKDIGGVRPRARNSVQGLSQSQITKMAVHSVMFQEIRSSQLNIKPEQYDQIYNRMCNNLQVIKEIQEMVKEQGNDLDKVDAYLESTYENAVQANKQLTQAQELQKKTRRMKFRMAVSGFFAALGYKILGLPGMIVGLFTGWKAS